MVTVTSLTLTQRIWINNRSPRSTFCRWKLLHILSPCVLSTSPHPLLLLTSLRSPAVVPPPHIHVQGERIWSSFTRQKAERGLLLLIHILCYDHWSGFDQCRLCVPWCHSLTTTCRLSFRGHLNIFKGIAKEE
jgi:hypothetical protein